MAVVASLNSKQYYLDRAEEMRTLAKTAANPAAQNGLVKAAQAYEALAKSAETLDERYRRRSQE